MASGHVNRAQRPNTWAAPTNAALVKKSPCQLGAVHTWPLAAAPIDNLRGSFRGIADTP